jgi:hypothetical protein
VQCVASASVGIKLFERFVMSVNAMPGQHAEPESFSVFAI